MAPDLTSFQNKGTINKTVNSLKKKKNPTVKDASIKTGKDKDKVGVVRAAWPVASLCDPLQRTASQDLLQIPGGEASGLGEFVENCWKEGGRRGIHKMAETTELSLANPP